MKINGISVEMSAQEMVTVLYLNFGGYFGYGYTMKDAVNAYLSRHPRGSGLHEPHKDPKYIAARLYWAKVTRPKSLKSS